MKFSIASIFFFTTAALAATVSYDTAYDNGDTRMDQVACSDGTNGMIRKGYKTFGALPRFPYIGGSSDIVDWNSQNCTHFSRLRRLLLLNSCSFRW
jgi:hypothetical protein